jgi:hypothetical protein
MKIEAEQKVRVQFCSLLAGDAFWYRNQIWVKADREGKAICLNDGALSSFEHDLETDYARVKVVKDEDQGNAAPSLMVERGSYMPAVPGSSPGEPISFWRDRR